jgi:hypothetical protein
MSDKYTSNKDVNKYLKDLKNSGYTIVKTSKHVKVFNKDNFLVTTVSNTTANWRSIRNIKSQYKKLMLEV